MKQFLTALLLLCAITIKAQTNVYHEFPDSNAFWNIHYSAYCFQNGSGNEDYSIMLAGDTIVNGLTYHQLFIPYVRSMSTGTCGYGPVGYSGAIREDVLQKKVYYLLAGQSVEKLLYDFNLSIGDTVKGFLAENVFGTTLIVQGIDSILIGSNYRKRFSIENCYGVKMIEGIGSTYGLIQRVPGCITDQPDFSIECFTQNGTVLFGQLSGNCELITDADEEKTEAKLLVFPNPCNGTLKIEITSGECDNLSIFDITGRTIHQQEVDQSTVTISNLFPGTYFISASNNGKQIECFKVVVID
jgi:hypothetical protein